MLKKLVEMCCALIIVAGLFGVVSQSASAHVEKQPKTIQIKCSSTTLIHLNGSQPPTITCLSKSKQQGVSPNTSTVGCGTAGALHIWMYSNETGPDTCFTGTGFFNMTDICYWFWYGCVNWNDQASSADTGCKYGSFYTDTNGNGSVAYFNRKQRGNFGSTFTIPAQSLSSIDITQDGGSSC